jgi:hypothetical protein
MATGAVSDDPKFIELDVLRSASGTKAVISQRTSNGVITFTIVKEFNRRGVADWTSFFAEDEIEDFEEMLGLVKVRIAELRADPRVAPVRERMAGVRRS